MRVLSQVAENTVYTFAMLLAVYLVGTALGRGGVRPLARRRRGEPDAAARPVAANRWRRPACSACSRLAGAEPVKAAVLHALGAEHGGGAGRRGCARDRGIPAAHHRDGRAVQPPRARSARAAGISFGRALGVNTLGAAVAPLAVRRAAVAGARREARAAARRRRLSRACRRGAHGPRRAQWATAGATRGAGRMGAAAGDRRRSRRRADRQLSQKGRWRRSAWWRTRNGVARLHINNRQQEGSSATLLADARQALLPILLHPSPRRALFLGLGTGVTASAAAEDPTLQVDAVELLPEVIEASALLHAHARRRRAQLAPAPDGRRRAALRARHARALRRDRLRQFPPGAQRIRLALHGRALPGRARRGSPRAACSANGCRCISSTSTRCAASCAPSSPSIPDGWAMLATNSLDTPVLGLVARARRGPLRCSGRCASD